MSELTGVSARTIQHWRTTGFFEPALYSEYVERAGYTPGELYSLGDVLAVKLIDILRDDTPMSRAVLEKLAPLLTLWYGRFHISPREFLEDEDKTWCTVPLDDFEDRSPRPDDPRAESWRPWPRMWNETELRQRGIPIDATAVIEVADPHDGSRVLLLPFSDIAADLVANADRWRREYRVPPDRCAPWV